MTRGLVCFNGADGFTAAQYPLSLGPGVKYGTHIDFLVPGDKPWLDPKGFLTNPVFVACNWGVHQDKDFTCLIEVWCFLGDLFLCHTDAWKYSPSWVPCFYRVALIKKTTY